MNEIWKRFDDRFFVLKLAEPVRQMHEEIESRRRKVQFERRETGQGEGVGLFHALVESDLDVLREFLERDIDRICREVWRKQGNSVTAEFVRVVLVGTVFNTIETRTGAIKSGIEEMAKRQNISVHLSSVRDHLARAIIRLKDTVSNRYEVEARELEYENAPTSESFSEGGVSKPTSGIAEGVMEDKQPKDAPKVRRVSQAPARPTTLSGGGSYTLSRTKPTQIPQSHPSYYPNELKPRTDVIVAEAVRKFPDQTGTLELCKYVISELTPLFRGEIRSKRLRADLALSRVGDLLHSLLVYNCDNENERFRLDQEARKSDEWLKLAKQIADVSQKQSNKKSKDALEAPVSSLGQNATHARVGNPEIANTVLRAQLEDAERDTRLWLQADPSAEERVCVLAMQVCLADLDRILTHRIEGRASPDEEGRWTQGVRELLSLLGRAREARGHIVGRCLDRLADHLAPHGKRDRGLETSASAPDRDAKPTNERDLFVRPILDNKGWSILDWANDSGVDFHTANNYLKGETKPYKSTRTKLAKSLGVDAQKLPS
jgi:hypothetical protein